MDEALLRRLHKECKGWRERVWEKLTEEHGVEISYPTLTRKMRELGIGVKPRHERVADEPGGEMQHDTSSYSLKIGAAHVTVIASLLYYRYSKQYYLRFYRSFNRFRMRCFLHEALSFYGYAAPLCIVDNTSLVVLSGSGKDAVISPEMVNFGKRYGTRFQAHALGHSDRKAGEERGFWTVETNFLPGRSFSSMEDLNAQALEWATVRWAARPRGKARLVPAQAFEYETSFLVQVPDGLPPPYRLHERTVDQYGFVAFAANFYWVPAGANGVVNVLEYADKIRLVDGRRELAEYALPPDGVRNKVFPEKRPHSPFQPRHRPNPTVDEEAKLRETSPEVSAYLDFAMVGMGTRRHRWLRDVYGVRQRYSRQLFCQIIERAHRFQVTDVATLEDIAGVLIRGDVAEVVATPFDEDYAERESFREGRFTDRPDFSTYDKLLEEDQDEDDG